MTAPAPFSPALEAAGIRALQMHWTSSKRTSKEGRVEKCDGCGEVLATYENRTAELAADPDALLAAHQWAAIVKAIAQHTTTEWGVDYRDGSVDLFDSRDAAEDYMPKMVGAEASEKDLPLLLARLVHPWERAT